MTVKRLKRALTRKLGPLPAWGWALVGGAALWYYRRKTATPAADAVAADPNLAPLDTSLAPLADPGTGTAAGGDPGSPTGGDLPLDPLPPLPPLDTLPPPDVLPPPDTTPPPPATPPPPPGGGAGTTTHPRNVSHRPATSAAGRTRAAAVHARQVAAARIRRSNQIAATVRLRHVTPALVRSPAFKGAAAAPHALTEPIPPGALKPHVLVAPLTLASRTGGRYSA